MYPVSQNNPARVAETHHSQAPVQNDSQKAHLIAIAIFVTLTVAFGVAAYFSAVLLFIPTLLCGMIAISLISSLGSSKNSNNQKTSEQEQRITDMQRQSIEFSAKVSNDVSEMQQREANVLPAYYARRAEETEALRVKVENLHAAKLAERAARSAPGGGT